MFSPQISTESRAQKIDHWSSVLEALGPNSLWDQHSTLPFLKFYFLYYKKTFAESFNIKTIPKLRCKKGY